VNSNLIYDKAEEFIAFVDSSIALDPEQLEFSKDILIDTTYLKKFSKSVFFKDSVTSDFIKDTVSGDSIFIPKKTTYTLHVDMHMFTEVAKAQFLKTKERNAPEKLFFTFSRPLYDSLRLTPLNFNYTQGLFLKEISATNDSITY